MERTEWIKVENMVMLRVIGHVAHNISFVGIGRRYQWGPRNRDLTAANCQRHCQISNESPSMCHFYPVPSRARTLISCFA